MPFYDVYIDLKKVGFEVGVAIPSISNEFTLNIKIGGDIQNYKYKDDISFVLNVLNICFEKGTPIENTFWKAYGELKNINIKLTKKNVKHFNLNSVIEILKTNNITIAKSSIETQRLLKKKNDKWRFFLPLDGPDSVIEAIRTMNLLKEESNNNDFDNVGWIVGKLDYTQYKSAPLLFLIKNSSIHLVLTDFLDVLIMVNGYKQVQLTETDLQTKFDGLLSIDSKNKTFSQEKADYAIELYNRLNTFTKQKKTIEKCLFEKAKIDDELVDALNIVRSFLQLDSFH